jgi:hypothetical protein
MSLSRKHERFCQAYAVDGDGPAAYRRVYPKATSERAARAGAERLLAKPEVRARIAELRPAAPVAEDARPTPATPEWTLEHLAHEATATGAGCTHSGRVAALGLLMRHFGLLAADAPHPDAPKFDLTKLTDEQKRAILAGLRLAVGGPRADAPLALAGPAIPP